MKFRLMSLYGNPDLEDVCFFRIRSRDRSRPVMAVVSHIVPSVTAVRPFLTGTSPTVPM